MKGLFILMAGLAAGSVAAAEFAHPDAKAIALMGEGEAQVCHFNRDWPEAKWECYSRWLQWEGAPLVISLPSPGPVVARNAAWAFAVEECVYSSLDLEGEIDIPSPGPKPRGHHSKSEGSLTANGEYGICPGWVPLEPGQPMN